MDGEMFNLIVGWSLLLFLIGYLFFPIFTYIGRILWTGYRKWYWRRELQRCQLDTFYFYQKYWKHVDDPVSIEEFFKDKV